MNEVEETLDDETVDEEGSDYESYSDVNLNDEIDFACENFL
jgi:hypothetical protein